MASFATGDPYCELLSIDYSHPEPTIPVELTYDSGWLGDVQVWIKRPAEFGCILHEAKEKAGD